MAMAINCTYTAYIKLSKTTIYYLLPIDILCSLFSPG